MDQRQTVARDTAEQLEVVSRGGAMRRALVGFDGFVDHIKHLVASRTSMAPREYTRIRSIPEFAARCAAAAGRSTNIEQVSLESRFGGNGPLLAGALASLGMPTTFIGAIGEGAIEPAFEPFARRCQEAIPICASSHTDCLEFDDGKLMLNDTGNVQGVTWERVLARVGRARLVELVDRSSLLGIVNWSLLGGVESIWNGLRRDVLAKARGERRLFIDLSDPAKRTDGDIAGMLGLLRELEETPGLSVTLGLNLAEAQRIARVLGLRVGLDVEAPWSTPLGSAILHVGPGPGTYADASARIRQAIDLDCVVIHPRHGAAAATASGQAAWFDGPLTARPKLSTGAGDHFNAGFALAQIHGLDLEHCLASAVATSGVYVRDAQSPSMARLCEFLRTLPPPQAPPPGESA